MHVCSWLEASLLALQHQPADAVRADEMHHLMSLPPPHATLNDGNANNRYRNVPGQDACTDIVMCMLVKATAEALQMAGCLLAVVIVPIRASLKPGPRHSIPIMLALIATFRFAQSVLLCSPTHGEVQRTRQC